MKDDASLNCAVGKIWKVCERKILIVPSISLECNTKKSDCFNVLLAYVLMFLKVCDHIFGKMRWCYPYAVNGKRKVISQSHEEYIPKLLET